MASETRRPSQSSSARRKPTAQRMSLAVYILATLYIFFTRVGFGRLLGILLIIAAVLALEMLFMRANAVLYFQVVGGELLAGCIFGWIYFLVRGLNDTDTQV